MQKREKGIVLLLCPVQLFIKGLLDTVLFPNGRTANKAIKSSPFPNAICVLYRTVTKQPSFSCNARIIAQRIPLVKRELIPARGHALTIPVGPKTEGNRFPKISQYSKVRIQTLKPACCATAQSGGKRRHVRRFFSELADLSRHFSKDKREHYFYFSKSALLTCASAPSAFAASVPEDNAAPYSDYADYEYETRGPLLINGHLHSRMGYETAYYDIYLTAPDAVGVQINDMPIATTNSVCMSGSAEEIFPTGRFGNVTFKITVYYSDRAPYTTYETFNLDSYFCIREHPRTDRCY